MNINEKDIKIALNSNATLSTYLFQNKMFKPFGKNLFTNILKNLQKECSRRNSNKENF